MFNLYEILQNAQGGQGVENLARQFNISAQQADAAVKAFMPALSTGFMAKAAEPFGFGALFGAMGDGQHRAAFDDPNAAQTSASAEKGNDILTQIFGSQNAAQEIAQKISAMTGLSPEIVKQMLPVMTSMILGGLTNALEKQGFGGLFGQFANAFQQGGAGAWGSVLSQMFGGGQITGGAPGQPSGQPGSGGFGGIFGNIMGSFFGARTAAAPGQTQDGVPMGGMPPMPGFDAARWQAGLDALNKMFQPGVQAPPPGEPNLQSEISDIMGGKPR